MTTPVAGDGFVPGRHAIDAYGAGGFRFADMSHVGSLLATPLGVRAIQATSATELNVEALAPLFAELTDHPRSIEILVIGTGEKMTPLPALLRDHIRQAGLRFEAMATGPATRVYNVLLGENRRVAAVLIAAP